MTKATTAIEALGECLADMEGALDEFYLGREDPNPKGEGAYRHYYRATISQATYIIEGLSARYWTLTPGPVVNAGEEVADA